MPKFSAFTPFNMLKFSSATSRGERIYRSMYAAKSGAFDLTIGEYQEAKVYAQSMGIARGRYALERAFNNQNPLKAIELLPALEKNWAVIPSETDTLLDRQLAVAARMMLVRGATREAITAGLQAILKTHFVALRMFNVNEATVEEPAGKFGPSFARDDLPFKVIRLTGPVALLGSPTVVPYTNADPSAGPILVQSNDVFMVQPENTGLAEVVTIISATATDLTATFYRSHDPDSFATTQNWVNWTSTQRVCMVVVDNVAALDAETVRRVDDFMSRASRGVSSWDIVQPTSFGATTVGPFTLDVSALGSVPLTQLPILPPLPLNISMLSPASGPVGGGTTVTVTGTGFSLVMTLTDDGTTNAGRVIVNDSEITFVTDPAVSGPGIWPVILTDSHGNTATFPFRFV